MKGKRVTFNDAIVPIAQPVETRKRACTLSSTDEIMLFGKGGSAHKEYVAPIAKGDALIQAREAWQSCVCLFRRLKMCWYQKGPPFPAVVNPKSEYTGLEARILDHDKVEVISDAFQLVGTWVIAALKQQGAPTY
eukprot:1155326-Pelagomonas_calceolata.AAC.4